MKLSPRLPVLILTGFLSSCSLLPHQLSSGGTVRQTAPAVPVLLVTPAPRLASQKTDQAYANDLATALAAYGVPTTTNRPKQANWELQISPLAQGSTITPTYQIIGPDKKTYGQMTGMPVQASEWTADRQNLLTQVATKDSASLSKTLAKINIQVQENNPNSLANRTPILFVGPVVGAPTDGDTVLAADLLLALKAVPLKLTPHKEDADFSVTGDVKTIPVTPTDNVAEINWIIHDSNGRLVGQVTQLRELKASAISASWSGTAPIIAQEAANGVLTVIHNDIVKTSKANPQKKKTSPLLSP